MQLSLTSDKRLPIHREGLNLIIHLRLCLNLITKLKLNSDQKLKLVGLSPVCACACVCLSVRVCVFEPDRVCVYCRCVCLPTVL